jgi:hypothetical protein
VARRGAAGDDDGEGGKGGAAAADVSFDAPEVRLRLRRGHSRERDATWAPFKQHHYLDASLSPSITFHVMEWRGREVGFARNDVARKDLASSQLRITAAPLQVGFVG